MVLQARTIGKTDNLRIWNCVIFDISAPWLRIKVLAELPERCMYPNPPSASRFPIWSEIGVTLMVRSHQKTRLTPDGEVFLSEAKKVLAAADNAVETVRRSARGEVGTLTVGFFNGGTGAEVPNVIRSFRRRHPGVRVSVVEMTPSEQSIALANGTMDVGFTRPLDSPFDQLLRSEVMYLDR